MCNISRRSDPYCLLAIAVIFIPLSVIEIFAAVLDIVGWPCTTTDSVISVLNGNISSSRIIGVSLTGFSISLTIPFNFIISVMMICSCTYICICYVTDTTISESPTSNSKKINNSDTRSKIEKGVIWTLFLFMVALALPAPVANINFFLQQCLWAYIVIVLRLIFSCTGIFIIVIAEYCHGKKDKQGMVDLILLTIAQAIELDTASSFLAVSFNVLDDTSITRTIKILQLTITIVFIISAIIRYFLTAVKLFCYLTATNLSKVKNGLYELVTHLTYAVNISITVFLLAVFLSEIHICDDRIKEGIRVAIVMTFFYLISSTVVHFWTSTFCSFRCQCTFSNVCNDHNNITFV